METVKANLCNCHAAISGGRSGNPINLQSRAQNSQGRFLLWLEENYLLILPQQRTYCRPVEHLMLSSFFYWIDSSQSIQNFEINSTYPPKSGIKKPLKLILLPKRKINKQ